MECVVENFSGQTFRVRPREVLLVFEVVFVGKRTELIRRRRTNGPDQILQIKLGVDEVLGQPIQQFGVGRRIRFAHIIFRFDNSATEEVLPVAVDECLREKRVLWIGHPVSQLRPRIFFWSHRIGLAPQAGRSQHFPCPFVASLCRALIVNGEDALVPHLVVAVDDVLAADPAEERGHAVVVVLAPLLKRMMVAAGTLNSQTQEQLGNVFDLLVRLVDFSIPGDRGIIVGISRRGQDFSHKLVIRLVLIKTGPDPLVEAVSRCQLIVAPLFVPQHQVPFIREVIRVSGGIE